MLFYFLGTRSMPFAISQIWREPTNHTDDCYFCIIDITKYRKGKSRKLNNPSIASIAPVPHDQTLPIPSPPEKVNM